MISILRHMDEYDIAKEVQMERMAHRGSFLLLEGSQDVRRFWPFIDTIKCSVVCAHSVKKARSALSILESRGIAGVVAVVDADFGRTLKTLSTGVNVVFSERHDLDLDWATTSILTRYLAEAGDEAKVRSAGGAAKIFNIILENLRPISCARLLNATGVFRFKVNNVEVGNFFCKPGDLVENYVDELIALGNVQTTDRGRIEGRIRGELKTKTDLLQITNGHDFCGALGAMLTSNLGARKYAQSWSKEVAMHLRLTMDANDFLALGVVAGVQKWEAANVPYKVLA